MENTQTRWLNDFTIWIGSKALCVIYSLYVSDCFCLGMYIERWLQCEQSETSTPPREDEYIAWPLRQARVKGVMGFFSRLLSQTKHQYYWVTQCVLIIGKPMKNRCSPCQKQKRKSCPCVVTVRYIKDPGPGEGSGKQPWFNDKITVCVSGPEPVDPLMGAHRA